MKTSKAIMCAALALFCVTAFASVQVYRLEHDTDTGVDWLVGGDNVRRPVYIMELQEYQSLTGMVETVWENLNKTPEGRKMLHGREVSHEIDTDTLRKVDIYADGYRWEQPIPPKRTRPEADSRGSQVKLVTKVTDEQKPKGMSARQWQMRKELRKARRAKPKTVTVERNAATGKDEVKK